MRNWPDAGVISTSDDAATAGLVFAAVVTRSRVQPLERSLDVVTECERELRGA
jgi:hypothetical protein